MERKTGKVKWFSDSKGFGFINTELDGCLFVHFSAILGGGFQTLREGEPVEFSLAKGQFGDKPVSNNAVNVVKLGK